MTLVDADVCAIPGCGRGATSYAVRLAGSVQLDTFVGRRTRPHELPTCPTHMMLAETKPIEFRRLLGFPTRMGEASSWR